MTVDGSVLRDVTLDDKFDLTKDRVFITGTQAVVRLLLMQRERDRLAGLNREHDRLAWRVLSADRRQRLGRPVNKNPRHDYCPNHCNRDNGFQYVANEIHSVTLLLCS